MRFLLFLILCAEKTIMSNVPTPPNHIFPNQAQNAQAAENAENLTQKYDNVSSAIKDLENEAKANRDELRKLKKDNDSLKNALAKQMHFTQSALQSLRAAKRKFRELVINANEVISQIEGFETNIQWLML